MNMQEELDNIEKVKDILEDIITMDAEHQLITTEYNNRRKDLMKQYYEVSGKDIPCIEYNNCPMSCEFCNDPNHTCNMYKPMY